VVVGFQLKVVITLANFFLISPENTHLYHWLGVMQARDKDEMETSSFFGHDITPQCVKKSPVSGPAYSR
jgi:hypothetical protein